MAQTKFLDYAGLESFVERLFAREFRGLGLSKNDFTDALKDKLENMTSPEDVAEFRDQLEALTALMESDENGEIDKFGEVVAFLEGMGDSENLNSIVSKLNEEIATLKDGVDNIQSISSDEIDSILGLSEEEVPAE